LTALQSRKAGVGADPEHAGVVFSERTNHLAWKPVVPRQRKRDLVAVEPAEDVIRSDPEPALAALMNRTYAPFQPAHVRKRRQLTVAKPVQTPERPDPERARAILL